jgi:hypothetical protein
MQSCWRMFAVALALHALVLRTLFALVAPGRAPPRATRPVASGAEIEFVMAHAVPIPSHASHQDSSASETSRPTSRVRARSIVRSPTPREETRPAPSPSALQTAPFVVSAAPPASSLGLELLRNLDAETARAAGVLSLAARPSSEPLRRDLTSRERTDPEVRAREATQGYLERLLAASHHSVPAGLPRYYWFLRRRMKETWQPASARSSTVDSAMILVRNVVSDVGTARDAIRQSLGPLASERGVAAADSVAAAHPNSMGVPASGQASDAPILTNTLQAIAQAGARRVGTEIELNQDVLGGVVSVRVVRPSRVVGFDDAAVRAVRDAVALQRAVPMPGGRRSRWRFEVIFSRDMIAVPIQQEPGRWRLSPMVGFDFGENPGEFDLRLPGSAHARARIYLLGSQPLGR